jgi:aspartate-semialdehyde dehydrogenase
MTKKYNISIVGATGAVGQELLKILETRNFPVNNVKLFASSRSVGKQIRFRDQNIACQSLEENCFNGTEIAFFDASDAVSKVWAPKAAESGAWVIDNSGAFRMDSDIPLVVPEINGHLVVEKLNQASDLPRHKVIAGPNCSTVQLVLALNPILQNFGLKRIVVSTYQSVSGAGAAAIEELKNQTLHYLKSEKTINTVFSAHQIAFNCIPQIGGFKPDGYTSEELKIKEETRKILSQPNLKISTTTVRVPTINCHSESVNVECLKSIGLEVLKKALSDQPGIIVQDDPSSLIYPMALTQTTDLVECGTGRDAVYVGRIRLDESVDNGLYLWIVSDNIRKGAALNAVQIGEIIVKKSSI